MSVHRKVMFPTENDEYRGFNVLFDKGSPISYLGERRYVVSEDDCKVLRKNGVTYRTLDSQ
ncbi:MAG: hypothetical protein ACREAO_00035 [Nitrososphaera sp.]